MGNREDAPVPRIIRIVGIDPTIGCVRLGAIPESQLRCRHGVKHGIQGGVLMARCNADAQNIAANVETQLVPRDDSSRKATCQPDLKPLEAGENEVGVFALQPKRFDLRHDLSPNCRVIAAQFGITARQRCLYNALSVRICQGEIGYIVGRSGSGKSALLAELAARLELPIVTFMADPATERADTPLLDAVGVASARAATAMLSQAGLGSVWQWLTPIGRLSDGERYRYRMARQLGEASLLCDEFASLLDAESAAAVARTLRHHITAPRFAILAGVRRDVLADLQPDWVLDMDAAPDIAQESYEHHAALDLQIRRCSVAAWEWFKDEHYVGDEGGFPAPTTFLLTADAKPAGIVIYTTPALNNGKRHRAFGSRLMRGGKVYRRHVAVWLNANLRQLARIAILPRFRGQGLAQFLIRHTVPRLGVRYIECLTQMGETNPFLAKAGFHRYERGYWLMDLGDTR